MKRRRRWESTLPRTKNSSTLHLIRGRDVRRRRRRRRRSSGLLLKELKSLFFKDLTMLIKNRPHEQIRVPEMLKEEKPRPVKKRRRLK